MFSTTVVAQWVAILAVVLPHFGIRFDNDQLTTIIQGLVILGTSFYTWYQRTKLQKAPIGQGDVSLLGVRRD